MASRFTKSKLNRPQKSIRCAEWRRRLPAIGLIVVALMITVVGGCRKKPKPVAQPEVTAEPAKSAAAEPAGPSLKIETVKATDPAINLIERVDPTVHATRGKAVRHSQQGETTLLLEPGQNGSQLIVPVVPPPHYELQVEVTRTNGNQTFFWGIVAGERRGMLSLDAFPRGGFSTGIGQIGKLRPGNENFRPRIRGQLLSNSRPALLRCVVTPEAIVLHHDGKLLLDVPAASVKQLRVPDFYKLPHDRCLFVGTWGASYRLKDFRLTPLTADVAAARVAEMRGAPRLKTLLIATAAPSVNAGAFRTAVSQTIREYRVLQRTEVYGADGPWETLAPKLAEPNAKATRQKIADHESADAIAVYHYVNGKNPHSRLTIFGPNAVVAGDFTLPYTGRLQTESALLAQSMAAGIARVESNPPLLVVGRWRSDPAARFWSGPVRELIVAALQGSRHCQLYEPGMSEVIKQFGNLPRFALSGSVQLVEEQIQVDVSLQKGQESLQRQWKFPAGEVPSGGELADMVLGMIAEMHGGAVTPAALADQRVPAALWASGRGARWQHQQDLHRAAAAHSAAGMLERREVHFAKAAWVLSQVSGEPSIRAQAYLDALQCLEFAEATSVTPNQLRGEGAFVGNIAELVLASGAATLPQLKESPRRSLLQQQADPLLGMIAHRLATGAPTDIYLKHLEATTPAAQRIELWRDAVERLPLMKEEVKALLGKLVRAGG